ncbi:hypothetical protein MKEN_00774400 [Mycena kentingensis (nom. inval.)]|nr:hypothetical protein MKEN_00774400 [Mycena kentingensis (nom. inval.)]
MFRGQPEWTRRARLILRSGIIKSLHVLNAACALHFLSTFGMFQFMYGPSMLPTLATHGEIAFEDRFTVRHDPSKIQRGDLLTVRSPLDPRRILCKRVIGLPGDVVCVDPTGHRAPSTEHVLIPRGHLWLAGDNAANSKDSRMFGPVPIGLVEGRLVARVWPLSRFTVFRNPTQVLGYDP